MGRHAIKAICMGLDGMGRTHMAGWNGKKADKEYRGAEQNGMDWNALACDDLGCNEMESTKKKKEKMQ
eukprot:scaffold195152_cov17-Prasinocladus_malaysianus.AAC.1